MNIFGKIFGAFFGGLIAGPIGFLIGLLIGYFFDQGLQINSVSSVQHVNFAKTAFFKSTFMIMGYLAKADGRISEQEIQMARNVMAQLQLNPQQKLEAIQYFNFGKSPKFNWEARMDDFMRNCGDQPHLIQLFIEIQLQAAFVDGLPDPYKRHALIQLCDKLSVSRILLEKMELRFRAEQAFHQQPRRSPKSELGSAYGVLGISENATNQEVKKAYRQLMSQHHPDKLLAKGLPESMIKVATEKTQRIQKAYEAICAARGM